MVPFFAYNGLDEDTIWVKLLLKEHSYNFECYGQTVQENLLELVRLENLRNLFVYCANFWKCFNPLWKARLRGHCGGTLYTALLVLSDPVGKSKAHSLYEIDIVSHVSSCDLLDVLVTSEWFLSTCGYAFVSCNWYKLRHTWPQKWCKTIHTLLLVKESPVQNGYDLSENSHHFITELNIAKSSGTSVYCIRLTQNSQSESSE